MDRSDMGGPESMTLDRKALESAGNTYPNLQGLHFLPIGVAFIGVGIGTFMGDPAAPWIFIATLLVAGIAAWRISLYYKANYGKVRSSRGRKMKDVIITAAGVPVLVGGVMLTSVFDLPISGYAAAYAAMMLVYGALTAGLRTHQKMIWGGFLVVALLPIWGAIPDGFEVSVALLPMGVVTIIAGLFDHRAFVRTFGKPGTLDGSRV